MHLVKHAICLLICFLACIPLSAQRIDHTSVFKTVHKKTWFRFQYDNDFFTKEDRYYSQGVSFEYVHPALKKNPLSRLLIKPRNSISVYGIALHLFAFTPTSILSEQILYGDRPYAAVIALRAFSIANDSIRRQRISSSFTAGIIGPAALGEQIQSNIHRWLGNPQPKGWANQVSNDVVLNYQVNYERQLPWSSEYFLINAMAEARAGTLDSRLNAGINFMAGKFKNPYYYLSDNHKPEYFFYGQLAGRLNAYDASLQGGLLNRKSPYTIPASDITRFNLQADAGIGVSFRKLLISYSQSFLTREFKTGRNHRWGGFNLGITF